MSLVLLVAVVAVLSRGAKLKGDKKLVILPQLLCRLARLRKVLR